MKKHIVEAVGPSCHQKSGQRWIGWLISHLAPLLVIAELFISPDNPCRIEKTLL